MNCTSLLVAGPGSRINATETAFCTTLDKLPDDVQHRILLREAVDNLFLHVACVSRVCRKWWRVVQDSPAYMYDRRHKHGQRARTLAYLSRVLPCAGHKRFGVGLVWFSGDSGGPDDDTDEWWQADFGDTLRDLDSSALTALGIAALALPTSSNLECFCLRGSPAQGEALAPLCKFWSTNPNVHLCTLIICDCEHLGDVGIVTLAAALPLTLTTLGFICTGCGDKGMISMMNALPTVHP